MKLTTVKENRIYEFQANFLLAYQPNIFYFQSGITLGWKYVVTLCDPSNNSKNVRDSFHVRTNYILLPV